MVTMTSPSDRSRESAPPVTPRLGYVIGTYPRLTTTFIDREVELLRHWGVDIDLVSIRRPDGLLSAEQQQLGRDVRYILPTTLRRFISVHLSFARRRSYWRLLRFLVSRPHPHTRARAKTVLHFGEGVLAADMLDRRGITHVHAHFIDRAATVAMTAAHLIGGTYSVTAHADDIYVDPVLMPEKIGRAKFVVTCTSFNLRELARLAPGARPSLHRAYHGLDASRYRSTRAANGDPPVVLAVGQLRPKKGFEHLIDACRQLHGDGRRLKCVIVGDGPLRDELTQKVRALGLDGIITLTGALTQDEVIEQYRRADIFALPCVVGARGDRDGIPNVILEAMAMELPVVSTATSGIPEAVVDEHTGLLVEAGDPVALADALARLLDNPALRARLGGEGRQKVLDHFDLESNVKELYELLVS
ncbi:MAG TPA: glycosyltransferase family 4 protein [Acidimicrobiales bacterium]|nr:glycosyltransferase family 4 protein [Acidimicrobiales bacterium]